MFFFCNSMSPSLDNDCTIQDLAFQVLKLFGVNTFNIRSVFHDLVLQTWPHLEIFVKTWQTQLWLMKSCTFFKTWHPKFWNVTCFCNSMSPSLDNDCTIQDLAFQVLKLFGVNNFRIRPLPRILSFMTWSSKTWTHLEIFVKTWQTQLWLLKSYTFFKTWHPKFWNVTCFCNSMSPSLDNDCTIQDLAFQVLKLFGVNNFRIRPLPRIISFMTWSSKTWTHLEIFVKTWQTQLWLMKSYTFFKTWHPKFWNVTCFCNSMSPSLDNDCTIQDLAFQVLKLFGVNNFRIRPLPRIISFMTWSSKTWTHLEIFVKTWQTQLWLMKSYTFFKTWHPKFWNVTCFCNSMSPSLDNDCTIQDLAFPVLKLFGVNKPWAGSIDSTGSCRSAASFCKTCQVR